MLWLPILLLLAGLVLLVGGAEIFVRGAARLAAMLGVSPLVIGLTVVAFGTSAPEIAVSVQAGAAGQADIAIGNVVGSNIANILLVLGISAAIAPLVVSHQLVRLDVPIMIFVSVLFLAFGYDGEISRLEGGILFGMAIAYTLLLLWLSRRHRASLDAEEFDREFGNAPPRVPSQWFRQGAMVVGGGLLLVWGSNWLVDGAVAVARSFGVSELVIGLTIIAVGTSLPEAATSVVASLRGERDIAVGNLVGSNIFNILVVIGVSSLVVPGGGLSVSSAALGFDIPVMLAVALACLPIFANDHRIHRWEGWMFFGYYLAYAFYLLLDSADHDALPLYSRVMEVFVLPLTGITLLVVSGQAVRSWLQRRRAGPGTG